MAEEARAGDRTPDATTMSGEAWKYVNDWALKYIASGQQPQLSERELFVLFQLAWEALPKYGHTYHGGIRHFATRWGQRESTVRSHIKRLIEVGIMQVVND